MIAASYARNRHGMTRDEVVALRHCGSRAKRHGIQAVEIASREGERYLDRCPALIGWEDVAAARNCRRGLDAWSQSLIESLRANLETASTVVHELPDNVDAYADTTRALSTVQTIDHLLDDVRMWVCADERALDPFYARLSWDRLEMIRELWQAELEPQSNNWASRHADPFWPARDVLRQMMAAGLWAMVEGGQS